MRGHPLARVPGRLLAGAILALLAGCVDTSPRASTDPLASVDLTITSAAGETMAFDPAEPVVHAARPIAITFRNLSSLPHNLVFTSGLTTATRTIVEPGTSDRLLLAPLAAGAYPFVCTIHDGMSGSLIVRSPGAAT